MTAETERTRVLLTKSRIDGHDRGVRYLATKLAEAGMEVVFTRYGTSGEIVNAALEEDVDVVGISFSVGSPLVITSEVVSLMREKGLGNVLLIIGGIIPSDEVLELLKAGVGQSFGPGASASEVVDFIFRNVRRA